MGEGDDDDRDLFEKALGQMSEKDLFRGKYGNLGEEAPQPKRREESAPTDAEAAAELLRLRDLRAMQDAFADIERIDQTKYRRQEPPPPPADLVSAPSPPAPKPAAEAPPKPVIRPVAELVSDPKTLNLRGLDPGKAVGQLALAVDLASKDGERVICAITGRDPVLRRTVLEWFAGPGAIYARRIEVDDPEGDTRVFAELRPSR